MKKPSFSSLGYLVLITVFSPRFAHASSAIWNGTADALWATEANWSSSPIPGTGDTATFNNAGNDNTTIGLGSSVTVASILFDTAGAAAYTIGSGAAGGQTLTLNHGGGITVGAGVINPQAVNSAITLGTDRAAATYTIANDSSSDLTFSGPITGAAAGGTAGIKTLAVTGSGNTTFNGNISKGGASNIFLTKSGAGILYLNGTMTLTGGFNTTLLSMSGGEIDLGTSGQLALNATDSRSAGVAGRGTIRGGIVSNAGAISSTGTLTIDSKVTSLVGTIGGGTSNKTILTNTDNTFSQSIRISSSTLEVSSVGALGTGSSIAFGTSNSGSGTLIHTGGSGTLNMAIIQGVNATTSGTITQSGTGALNITGAVTNQNTFNLTLNGSTSGTGELSGSINISSGSITKSGTGTWTLSGTNTYTTRTTISGGVLSVASIGNGSVAGNLGQASNAAANLVLDGGTLRYTGADASTDRSFTLSTGKTSTIEVTANTLSMTGSVPASTGALVKTGTGTLVLAGPNNYTGGTTLSAGTLRLATPGAAGSSSAGLKLNGGILALATDTSVNSHPVNVGGTTTIVADRATDGEGITHALGKLTIGSHTLSIVKGTRVTSGNATVTFADTVLTGNAVFEIPVGTTLVLGNITQSGGSFGITTTGGGSLVIDRNSSYTGNTNITGCSVKLTGYGLNSNNLGKIMPLGDSITAGSPTTDGGYRVRLNSRLTADSGTYQFVGSQTNYSNLLPTSPVNQKQYEGHPGRKIQWILDGVTPTAEGGLGWLDKNPDIILLHIGTNDLNIIPIDTIENTLGRLEQLVDMIFEVKPAATLLIAKLIPMRSSSPADPQQLLPAYNAGVAQIVTLKQAQGKRIFLVDMNTSYPAGAYFDSQDHVHPNAIGYNWMADRWYEAITAVNPDTVGLLRTPALAIGSGATIDLNGQNQTMTALADQNGIGGQIIDTANLKPLTLTIDCPDGTSIYSGSILDNAPPNGISLVKTGVGTQVLSGANPYTGTTTVKDGTLLINGSLSGSGAVTVNGTSILGGSGSISGSVTVSAAASLAPGDSVGTLTMLGGLDISELAGGSGTLNFELGPISASDRIAVTGNLNIGSGTLGFSDFDFTTLGGLHNGTYKLITSGGISGTLDASNISGPVAAGSGTLQITGNDLEIVVSGLSGATGFSLWASTNAPSGTSDDDYDGDGVSNGVEYVLGGTKETNDLSKLPQVTSSANNMFFTFLRDQDSIDGSTSVVIEVGTDLATWSTAPSPYTVPESAVTNVPGVSVTKDSPVAGTDTITLSVPRGPDERKFARLKVIINP